MWKALGTDPKVLSWLAYGKKTTFNEEPDNLAFPNTKSALQNWEFITQEVEKGLKNGTLMLVDYSFAKVINPITVDRKKKNNKLRMCLDLRYPNSQTAWARFKLATLLNTLPHELRQGDIIFTDDLDSAYHSVMMHEDTWPYMCFDSPLGLVCPTVLSFGDGLAPFIFSKITRPITAFCHVIGLRIMSYLDDFLWMARCENAESTKKFARWLMPALGWISNTNKADWSMGSVKESLGFMVNAEQMRLHVTADKIANICGLDWFFV
jgi:hypothetical protein